MTNTNSEGALTGLLRQDSIQSRLKALKDKADHKQLELHDESPSSTTSNRLGAKAGKRSATVYTKKEANVRGASKKKSKVLDVKKGSNEDIFESEEKVAFYQPVQLKDIAPMVEIDSDGSQILDSPESIEKKEKLERARQLEDKISHMRHRKIVEDAIKQRRETALHQKKAI